MDTDLEYDFTNAEVKESEPVTPSVEDLACKVCSRPLTYGGRGPKPKYCADHKRKTTSTPRAKKKTGTDYREAVTGLLQVPAMALTMIGTSTKKPEYLADAFMISHHSPGIASAISDIANDRPEVAAVLDKVLKVGPYSALLTALMPLAIQIAANHKLIQPGMAGTYSSEQILEFAQAQAEAQAQANA